MSSAFSDRIGRRNVRDRVGHAAVFYYGAVFALVELAALIALIPNRRDSHS